MQIMPSGVAPTIVSDDPAVRTQYVMNSYYAAAQRRYAEMSEHSNRHVRTIASTLQLLDAAPDDIARVYAALRELDVL